MEASTAMVTEASAEYVGRWNLLVSTTNWQKGRLIVQWREALCEAGAGPEEYTDEAWSRRVGGVSPQHVGRLRRVCERFGDPHEQYDGLYWSHFHAALDWPDAEMYLEGAVQNGWSVPAMRAQRRDAIKAIDAENCDNGSGLDVAEPEVGQTGCEETPLSTTISETISEVRAADADADTDDCSERNDCENYQEREDADGGAHAAATGSPAVRPFESLPELPPDVNEAFELMKLAILAHKVSGWRDMARDDMLAVLESLRRLALAPTE